MMRCSVVTFEGWNSPRSQLIMENWETFRIPATAFWVSLSRSRHLRIWSPTVWSSKSVSFLFNALSRMGTNCKRATRPCACGFLGHYNGRCRCTPDQVLHYRRRISGPLLDRIDIQIEVPSVPPEDLTRTTRSEER